MAWYDECDGVDTTRVPTNSTVWPENEPVCPVARCSWPRWRYDVAAASPMATTTTPMWTTMPPLARPTKPRHPVSAARPPEAPAERAPR